MATQKDVQDLLRLLTTGRNKLSMMAAMGRIKALQAADLKSISAIASADLNTLQNAISDEKAAKALQTAAKNAIKDPSSASKRPADPSLNSPDSKRRKSAYELDGAPQTPEEVEAALALPAPSTDEEAISRTVIQTNRAPLVLAFAVELLKYTMPEQPLSSRLSLAQAVVSANSRSKAVSIGIEKGASAEQEGWGMGQPKVRVMGREVHVLKRGGYNWKPPTAEKDTAQEELEGKSVGDSDREEVAESASASIDNGGEQAYKSETSSTWAVSQRVTLKKSTFVARSIGVNSPSQARSLIRGLLSSNSELRDASHNITAWRVQGSHGIIEECNDDGESGGGRHVLQLLQSMNLVGVLVVLTRWYGGIMLGTDRWRLMSEVCRDALSQRLRITGTIGQEPLWGLDLETMRSASAPVTGGTAGGMPVHKPEAARGYIMRAFASADTDAEVSKAKKTKAAQDQEKERNLGLLLGALDLLFQSWVGHLGRDELDRRAWSWYVQVRPEVESGVAGWGAKGVVKLVDMLSLRRKG